MFELSIMLFLSMYQIHENQLRVSWMAICSSEYFSFGSLIYLHYSYLSQDHNLSINHRECMFRIVFESFRLVYQ
jgi:hypothetical protein